MNANESRIAPFLPPQVARVYDSQDWAEYENGLSQVERWQGGQYPLGNNQHEYVLDHIVGAMQMVDEIKQVQRYSQLPKQIDFGLVKTMLALHETGEMVTGDVCASNPAYTTGTESTNGFALSLEGERLKRLESRAARIFVFSQISDPEVRQNAITLYECFEAAGPRSLPTGLLFQFEPELQKAALFAQFIDKAHGNFVGLTSGAFSFDKKKGPSENLVAHITNSITKMVSPVSILLPLLRPEAQRELALLTSAQLHYFNDYGFKRYANPAHQELTRILVSLALPGLFSGYLEPET